MVGKEFEHLGDRVESDHGAGQPGDQEPWTTADVEHRCRRNVVERRSEPFGRGERCSDSGVAPVDGRASIDRRGDRVQAHRLTSPAASLELAHPGEPATPIASPVELVARDFGVGEYQEVVVGQACGHGLGDLLGFDHAHGLHDLDRQLAIRFGHRCANSLRTQARDTDARIAVRDRDPFGERDRAVFRDGVRGGAQVGQQACCGCGDEEVTGASSGPPGDEVTTGLHVSEHVVVPVGVPLVVAQFDAPFAPMPALPAQRSIGPWSRSTCSMRATIAASSVTSMPTPTPPISSATAAAPRRRDRRRTRSTRRRRQAPSHGSTDTACGSGDNDDCSLNLHGADRRPLGPRRFSTGTRRSRVRGVV